MGEECIMAVFHQVARPTFLGGIYGTLKADPQMPFLFLKRCAPLVLPIGGFFIARVKLALEAIHHRPGLLELRLKDCRGFPRKKKEPGK
jgi:hypothetical protein